MNTNTKYSFEELFNTAETMLMNFEFCARNDSLVMLYDNILRSTKGLHFSKNDTGGIASIEIEHIDVGYGQKIVMYCGKAGHTLKIFDDGVELFSHELTKEIVQILYTLASLQSRIMYAYNIPLCQN